MSIREGPLASEGTGQHTATFVLTNRGPADCTLRGYPRIVLLTGDLRTLPFTYSDSGDQMITKRRPETVHVASGRSAFFAINKYRCDIHSIAGAVVIRVLLPDSRHWLHHALNRFPGLDYCPAEVPSRTLAVSPVVNRLRNVFVP
jgi:hypothetical protein